LQPRFVKQRLQEYDAYPVWSKTSDKFNAVLCESKIALGIGSKGILHKRLIITSNSPEYIILVDFLKGKGQHISEHLFQIDADKIIKKINGFELKYGNNIFSIIKCKIRTISA
jgi:hypothetical protein